MVRKVHPIGVTRSSIRRVRPWCLARPISSAENPFILVLAEFFPATDPFVGFPQEVLTPFAHLGMELTSRQAIDSIAGRGLEAGCLAMEATQMPMPIGYICMLRDPDGNMVEFSFDQGVYAKAKQVWGTSDVTD